MKHLALAFLAAGVLTSCVKEENEGPGRESQDVEFFISTEVNAAGQESGYLLATPDITQGTLSIKGQGLEMSGYNTWIFPTEKIGIGLKYQKGDPGLGVGVKLGAQGNIEKSGAEFRIESRYTTYGVFQNKVLTAVGGVKTEEGGDDIYSVFNFIDPAVNNKTSNQTINTTNLTGNGEYATLSGIVQFNENTFLTALVPSIIGSDTGEGGSSTGPTDYPDSVWVAMYDQDLKLQKVFGDDRIGYASGRFRSAYYSTISADGAGNVYVFSPAVDERSSKPAGVIRINKGADDFDKDYYWDLENELGADKEALFYHVYHVKGDLFVLDFRRTTAEDPNQEVAQANALAVVNVKTKDFHWVSGLPEFSKNPVFGNPIAEDGKLYIPVSLTTGEKPAVYIVDAESATAKRGLEVDASSITAVGKLRK